MSVIARKPVLPIRLMSDLTDWLRLTAGAETDALTDSDCPPTPRLTRADWLGLLADTETDCPLPPYTLPFPPNRDQTYISYSFNIFFKFQENLYRIYRESIENLDRVGWNRTVTVWQSHPQSSHREGGSYWFFEMALSQCHSSVTELQALFTYLLPFPPNRDQLYLTYFFSSFKRIYIEYKEYLEGGRQGGRVEANNTTSHRGGLRYWKSAFWLPPFHRCLHLNILGFLLVSR